MNRWIAGIAIATFTAVLPAFAADAASPRCPIQLPSMASLSDFDGNYVALSAGAAIAGGEDAVYLQNQHGVVIRLAATEIGLRFNLVVSGVNIALKD